MQWQFWIIQTLNSVAFGGLLFLLSSGFSLIFGLMRIPNLAHGAFFMLGAYFGYTLLRLNLHFWLAAIAGGLGVGLLGILMERLLLRPETKDPWTVKDALAHITHWKADVARSIKGQPVPPEERGLSETEGNRLVYMRWRDRSPQEVLAWHRQVHENVLAALREAPDKWFSGKERRPEWPFDLDGHSTYHRVNDIERALAARP